MNEILLYIGSGVIIVWAISHLVVTKAVVNGFGEISEDNRKVIIMEWVGEGLALVFLGVLALLVTLVGSLDDPVTQAVLWATAAMLLIMALLTQFTGARTPQIPFKICPYVKTATAVLMILAIVL